MHCPLLGESQTLHLPIWKILRVVVHHFFLEREAGVEEEVQLFRMIVHHFFLEWEAEEEEEQPGRMGHVLVPLSRYQSVKRFASNISNLGGCYLSLASIEWSH